MIEFYADEDSDTDDDGVYVLKRDQQPHCYKIVKYIPQGLAIRIKNGREPQANRGYWKTLPRLYTNKQIDGICALYYQWGDVIKVKRVR